MDGAELAGVSHVIVDEVHERSVDGDFLLILLAVGLGSRVRGLGSRVSGLWCRV